MKKLTYQGQEYELPILGHNATADSNSQKISAMILVDGRFAQRRYNSDLSYVKMDASQAPIEKGKKVYWVYTNDYGDIWFSQNSKVSNTKTYDSNIITTDCLVFYNLDDYLKNGGVSSNTLTHLYHAVCHLVKGGEIA